MARAYPMVRGSTPAHGPWHLRLGVLRDQFTVVEALAAAHVLLERYQQARRSSQ